MTKNKPAKELSNRKYRQQIVPARKYTHDETHKGCTEPGRCFFPDCECGCEDYDYDVFG